jgi:hypothetical protein
MKRLGVVLVALVAGSVVSASAAPAATPTIAPFSYTYSAVMTGYCGFGVDVVTNATGTRIDFVDANGALTRRYIHQLNIDTFSANGKTLTSLPFVFNLQQFFDSSGQLTQSPVSGVIEQIPLPDGSLFVSAGRDDFAVPHPGIEGHILAPNEGSQGDIAAFCAALSP